ncbi:MAG: MarR family transcriptional regulator [Bacilli bacterium]|nr:MarR family transcriptional regulator [Bacilli bacterium]HHU23531.1 MarR family transcriptional regulator [Acholeplasmataceae bacterium]
MKKSQALINELLVDVFNHILSIEEAELRKAGIKLSMNEVHILEAVKNVEYPTMTNIAKRLRITTGTLTTSIDRLVQKKYVVRANDENDRRKVLIQLTPSATDVLKAHDKFHSEMVEALFEDMKIDEDEVLVKSLESIAEFFRSKY